MRAWWGLLRSLVIYWRPGRQGALRELYAQFVGPDDLVFDVGAHLGDRTAAFSALGARVVALEPNPRLLPWLRRLVGGRPGVVIVPRAAGPSTGSASLAVSPGNPTVSTLDRGWTEQIRRTNPGFSRIRWNRQVEVPVTTLDELIREHGEPRFCKVDVEGFEDRVLAGLTRPLEALSVEFVAGSLGVTVSCVERLADLDAYEYNAISGEERRFLFSRWRSSAEALAWLHGGAGGIPSGDLYARRLREGS